MCISQQETENFYTNINMRENFDVVDISDRVLRQATRQVVHQRNLLHRAIHILVFRSSGRLIIQQRAAGKDVDPFLWTSSCSGHVDAGEGYVEAGIRECMEELGVSIKENGLRELLRLSPCKETGNEFVRVYSFIYDGKISFNKDEIIQLKECSLAEIINLMDSSPKEFSSSFSHILTLINGRLLKK